MGHPKDVLGCGVQGPAGRAAVWARATGCPEDNGDDDDDDHDDGDDEQGEDSEEEDSEEED